MGFVVLTVVIMDAAYSICKKLDKIIELLGNRENEHDGE